MRPCRTVAAAVLAAALLMPMVPATSAERAPRCAGRAATIVGDGDGDGLIRGTEGPDVIVGSDGDDRIEGRGGNDVICGRGWSDRIKGNRGDDWINGQSGTDTCFGGWGEDYCDGASPRPNAYRPSERDTCAPDVETRIGCEVGPVRHYLGTASGTILFGGLKDEWTATYDLRRNPGNPFGYGGPATFTWERSGTFVDGCTYTGGGTTEDAGAGLSFMGYMYRFEIAYYPESEGTVYVDCPDEEPYTIEVTPLDSIAARTSDPLVPEDRTLLSGSRTYQPREGMDLDASWEWTLRAASRPQGAQPPQ